jgi:hypothetical protein
LQAENQSSNKGNNEALCKGGIMFANRPKKDEEPKSIEQQTLDILKTIDQKLTIITAIVVVAALIAVFS